MKRKRTGSTAGFTLVELIVVIAILGILAGGAGVGYSGYVKNANKNADKVLVGNIMRAIETGTNSTMFVNDDSFVKGATVYPVGVIVLTSDKEDGTPGTCQVMASSSVVKEHTTECRMTTAEIVTSYTTRTETNPTGGTLDKIIQAIGITPPAVLTEYTITGTKTIEYCAAHTTLPKTTVDTKIAEDTAYFMGFIPIGDYWMSKATGTFTFLDECTGIYKINDASNGHVAGGSITQEELEALSANSRVTETTSGALYDSVEAAFGEPTNLKLQYKNWGNAEDEGHTYATLNTYTDTLFGDINSTAETLIWATDTLGLDGYLSKDYKNSADMVSSFATELVTKYPTMDEWMSAWNSAVTVNDVTWYFGLEGRDYIYAARMGYDAAFASYCQNNGIPTTYSDVIKNYSASVTAMGITLDNVIPNTVCTAAFAAKDASNKNNLYAQFINAGDDGTYFDQCAKLYEIYKTSAAHTENGKAFYNTMATVDSTGSDAFQSGSGGNDAFFDYYNNYAQEMSAFYKVIQNQQGKGIIIVVTVEDGVVKCDVSPSAANPRNSGK